MFRFRICLRFFGLTSVGLLMPLISHFASTAGFSFSVTFSTATSLFSLALMMCSFLSLIERREMPACLLACGEEARWEVCAVWSRVKLCVLARRRFPAKCPREQRRLTKCEGGGSEWEMERMGEGSARERKETGSEVVSASPIRPWQGCELQQSLRLST